VTLAHIVGGGPVWPLWTTGSLLCGSAVPGTGRLLSVSVDGRQVDEVNADAAVVTVATGEHTLRVELVTTTHQEYAPPGCTP
jgi:hypothetical protein